MEKDQSAFLDNFKTMSTLAQVPDMESQNELSRTHDESNAQLKEALKL